MSDNDDGMRPSTHRVVWVTGAAGGIGAAIAGAYARVGAKVVATDQRPWEAVPGIRTITCDVTSAIEIEAVIAECDRLGGIDTLVNCAGILRRDDVLEITPQVWDRLFDVNVKGAFLCAQAAARSMISAGRRGSIVNIGSINAEKVFADTVAYCTSKGALQAMSRAMALSLAPHGIRVNNVAPGAIADTRLEPTRWAQAAERDAMRLRTPLRELGASTDVASAVIFLGSPGASFITGATLLVDGGRAASV
ncbi:MAG: SDR family oxidoreductase [Caldimonas sp.]